MLVIYTFILIVGYTMLFLGSCSPLHCRVIVSIVGIICVMLSVGTGFSICKGLGFVYAEVHQALPILMLGIGVDDMFIICNALDQNSLK